VACQDWPLAPDLALVKSPVWDQADDDLKAAFAELAGALGPRITEVDLPDAFKAAHGLHGLIMGVDLARSFAAEYARGPDQLSERLRGIIEDGRRALAIDYARALALVPTLRDSLDPLFSRYDMIVTPAATGQPRGLENTGSPAFCTIWTLLGLPAVTLPLLTGADGMPMGVQLVGRFGDDARVLRTARWLVTTIAGLDTAPAAHAGCRRRCARDRADGRLRRRPDLADRRPAAGDHHHPGSRDGDHRRRPHAAGAGRERHVLRTRDDPDIAASGAQRSPPAVGG
jgi:hypothetical protein